MARTQRGNELRRAAAIVALPTVLIVVAYGYLRFASASRELAGLRQGIVDARRNQPSLAEEAKTQRAIDELRVAHAELEARAPRIAQDAAAVPVAANASPLERAHAREELAKLLVEHDLALLEELVGAATPVPLPPNMPLPRSSTDARDAQRSLRFLGRWFDVQALLEDVRERELRLVPLQLKLSKERDLDGVPEWTLVVI